MEIQRERGGEGRSIYAKQQRARRAKPSDGVEEKEGEKEEEEKCVQQSKTETAARKMRAKSAHVRTFADAEGQQIQLRKSPKLGRVRLRKEDETPESERNLTLPCPWTRCKDVTAPGTIKSFLFLIPAFGPY